MTGSVDAIGAIVLAVVVVGSAFGMLSTRNVVHAAFWMLATMLGTAGIYLLLSAGFLAMVQIMVYAGAVAVLLLFVIMLTLRRREDAVRGRDFSLQALSIASLFAIAVGSSLVKFAHETPAYPKIAPGVAAFGRELFTQWILPFELSSLILTVALVGAIWWANGGNDQ